jgi:glycosyltransferase involved in cell wall biosynthesis
VIKVSITISTYNVEEYIAASMKSILGQTLLDVEIICVDDGSSDNTPKILKEFAAADDRIVLELKLINEGLAVSRNRALELAKGKYITFLDGDDLYDSTMLEKAYNLAENEHSDLVIWDYQTFVHSADLDTVVLEKSRLENFDKANKVKLLQLPAFTWIKLINTAKARELGVNFPKGMTRQDIPVHWKLMTSIDAISILPEKLAFYRQQPNATTSQKDARVLDLAYVLDISKKYLVESNLYIVYKDEFLRQRLNLLYGMYDSINDKLKPQALALMKERLNKDELYFINRGKYLRPRALLFYKAIEGDIISKIKYFSWITIRSLYRKLKSLIK